MKKRTEFMINESLVFNGKHFDRGHTFSVISTNKKITTGADSMNNKISVDTLICIFN